MKERRRNASINACTKVTNKKSQSHVLLVARAAIKKVFVTSSPCSLTFINAPTLEIQCSGLDGSLVQSGINNVF